MGVFLKNKFSDFLLVWGLVVVIAGMIFCVGALKNIEKDLNKIARELEKRNFILQSKVIV